MARDLHSLLPVLFALLLLPHLPVFFLVNLVHWILVCLVIFLFDGLVSMILVLLACFCSMLDFLPHLFNHLPDTS